MIVLLIIIIAILAAIFFLRGEGANYAKGSGFQKDKRRVNLSDKNFFL